MRSARWWRPTGGLLAADWLPLLRSPVHEHRLAALVVMSERAGRGKPDERSLVHRTYLANTAVIDNWDLVDVSAASVIGGWLLDHDRADGQDLLDQLAGSVSRWERRIAVVSTHAPIRAGRTEEIYRLAVSLLDEPEDLIHKAIGWMLRESGVRVSVDELRRFLDTYASRLPATTLRYAIERLPVEEHAHYRRLGRHDRL